MEERALISLSDLWIMSKGVGAGQHLSKYGKTQNVVSVFCCIHVLVCFVGLFFPVLSLQASQTVAFQPFYVISGAL